MQAQLYFAGVGHKTGSQVVSNRELATSLGLKPDWFLKRTGIEERRVCEEDEDVLSLAVGAITNACKDAGLDMKSLGHETVLIHIQNGFTHLTPPPGIILCDALGFSNVRVVGIDGVCSEPINALEIAGLMLMQDRCERVIISASVDFMQMVNPKDEDTAGLFGAGAGALIVEQTSTSVSGEIKGIYWETQSKYHDLGVIPVLHSNQEEDGVSAKFGFYDMKGKALAKVALSAIPRAIKATMGQAGWALEDIDLIIAHQPNAKLLEMGISRLGLDPALVAMPVKKLGNMGPASLLVSLSMAHRENRIMRGSKVLLVSFGLGFSCGAATIVF